MTWEQIKIVLECITSICFLVGVWKGVLFFGYKNDSTIRNLYIEHAKKIDKIFYLHYWHSEMNEELRQLLFEVSKDAILFLHKDIVNFTERLTNLLFDLDILRIELDDLPVGDKRTKICEKQCNLRIQIHEIQKEYLKIYRKHILKDGLDLTRFLDSMFKNDQKDGEEINAK